MAFGLLTRSNGQNLAIQRIPADVINITNALPYADYVIQTSTNLSGTNWQNVATVSGNGSSSFSYTNFPNPGFGQLFYRTVAYVDTAGQALISRDGMSPLSETVGVENTVEGQYLGLPVLVFDVNAEGDTIHLHNVAVNIESSGEGTVNAAYLYQGSTPIASSSIVNGVATFSNIADEQAGTSIAPNTTVPFTVKVDVTGLYEQNSQETLSASVTETNFVLFNSADNQIPVSGNAVGSAITVVSAGPIFSLASTPTITAYNITSGGSTDDEFLITATFNVNVTAVGENVNLGLPTSTNAAFGSSNTSTNIAQMLINAAPAANNGGYQITASYAQPTNTTLSSDGTYFTLAQNQSVTIPVTYSWIVQNAENGNQYGIELVGINWSTEDGTGYETKIPDPSDWETGSIQ